MKLCGSYVQHIIQAENSISMLEVRLEVFLLCLSFTLVDGDWVSYYKFLITNKTNLKVVWWYQLPFEMKTISLSHLLYNHSTLENKWFWLVTGSPNLKVKGRFIFFMSCYNVIHICLHKAKEVMCIFRILFLFHWS